MKKYVLLFLMLLVLKFMQGIAFGYSLEITTGSGTNEGIVDKNGKWVRSKSVVQIISAYGGESHSPDNEGKPSGGDKLICETFTGYNFPFNLEEGKFDIQASVYKSKTFYVRVWNKDGDFGDSDLYVIQGFVNEIWNINGDINEPAIKIGQKLDKELEDNE